MKRTLWCGALFLVVLAMLLPVIASVNNSAVHIPGKAKALRADGPPLPPIPPKSASHVSFIGKIATRATLRADGPPLPPIPPKSASLAMLA